MERPRRPRTLAEPDIASRNLPDTLSTEGSVALMAEDSIALRAYRRFEERGRQDGHDLDDWLEAEREFNRTASQ